MKCLSLFQDSIEELADGTYYLTKVDAGFKRYYALKGHDKQGGVGVLSPQLPPANTQNID